MNTEILVILDRSGSMEMIATDVIGSYNRFLAEQQKEPGAARLTLVLFNSDIRTHSVGEPIAYAKPLNRHTYRPEGMTALLDALGFTLEGQGERIYREKRAERVIVAILTDGQENASTRYRLAQVNAMIEHARAHGWVFVFLAANQDAIVEARKYGIDPKFAANFAASGSGTQAAYGALGQTVSSLRAGSEPEPLPEDLSKSS
jgi:Mg-chelatase subunit ChlD